jgi:hypothetical protein
VIQEDSSFNFSDLMAHHSGGTEKDSLNMVPVEQENPYKYHLYDLELRHAQFEFENRDFGDTLQIQDISFTIPYIGWDQNEKSEAGLRFNLEKDGYLEAGININPIKGDFDASLVLQNVYIESFRNYAVNHTNLGTIKGVLNTQLEIEGNINQPENSIISGELELLDLLLADEQSVEFFSAGAIRVGLQEVDPLNGRYILNSIILSKPYIFFELKDSTNNFFEVFNYAPSDSASTVLNEATSVTSTTVLNKRTPDTSGTDQSKSLYYAIQSFRMEEGTIEFRDHTTSEPFDYLFTEMEIHADSIESSANWVSLYANMLLNNRGNLVAEIGFDPLAPQNFMLDYNIRDFQLSDLNIYSNYYTGFPILYGEMFYTGHTEVADKKLVSDNHLILDHVKLGNKGGGLHDLPLKFALYILKDRNDVIDLEIPVRGRTDDPRVSVGKIVWNTLKNLIIRTATAPYDFLSQLLGVDPGDIQAIEFDYRDTTLTAGLSRQLDLLLELEEIKPFMEIDLVYHNDLEREKREILMAETGIEPTSIQAFDTLADEILQADSVVALYSDLRIRKLEEYLRSMNDSTQIRILRSNEQDPKNANSRPRFEAAFSMKDENLVR